MCVTQTVSQMGRMKTLGLSVTVRAGELRQREGQGECIYFFAEVWPDVQEELSHDSIL